MVTNRKVNTAQGVCGRHAAAQYGQCAGNRLVPQLQDAALLAQRHKRGTEGNNVGAVYTHTFKLSAGQVVMTSATSRSMTTRVSLHEHAVARPLVGSVEHVNRAE